MIPCSTQDISKADMRAVARVLRSGWLTQDPAVERIVMRDPVRTPP